MILIWHDVLLSGLWPGLSSITACRKMYSTFFALFRTDKLHSHFFIFESSVKSLTAYSNNKNLWIFQRFPLHYDTNIFLLIKISSDNSSNSINVTFFPNNLAKCLKVPLNPASIYCGMTTAII